METFMTECQAEINSVKVGLSTTFLDACQVFISSWPLEERITILKNLASPKAILADSIFTECRIQPFKCTGLWDYIYGENNKYPVLTVRADELLENYCRVQSTDPKCACLAPPSRILTTKSTRPIVCWYSGCTAGETYKTSRIRADQQVCSGTLCIITVRDIMAAGDRVTILNNCIVQELQVSDLALTSIEHLQPLQNSYKIDKIVPVYPPIIVNYFHIFLLLVFIGIVVLSQVAPRRFLTLWNKSSYISPE